MKEMAKEVKNSHNGEIKQTAEDLDEFLNKVMFLLTKFLFCIISLSMCYLASSVFLFSIMIIGTKFLIGQDWCTSFER